MASRASANPTALRRLMTEYKQLTSGGPSVCAVCYPFTRLAYATSPAFPTFLQARLTACSRPVRGGQFCQGHILTPSPVRSWVRLSIYFLASRPGLRIRLLHLGGPHLRTKGYSLCKACFYFILFFFLLCIFSSLCVEITKHTLPPPRPRLFQEGGVFAAKLTFVR